MPEKSDEAYMLDVQSGDLSSLSVLFERYQVPIYNYFLKLQGDIAVSEDLTQQLFIRLLQFRMSYRAAGGSFRSWLYKMATNLSTDQYRKQAKVRNYNMELTEMHESYTQPEHRFGEQDYRVLDMALQELDMEERQLLVLSKYQGMRYEEISGMMDLSVSNVKVKVHRAILQLRKIYFKKIA